MAPEKVSKNVEAKKTLYVVVCFTVYCKFIHLFPVYFFLSTLVLLALSSACPSFLLYKPCYLKTRAVLSPGNRAKLCKFRHVKSVRNFMWKLCYRKDGRTMRPIRGCPENFRDSLTTTTATIPTIFHAFLFRSTLWMFLQNLKSVALPVPEIIGGTVKSAKNIAKKFGQSLDTPTLPFLQNF